MKKSILLLSTLLVIVISSCSQKPIEFMGIPVDGTKQKMIGALKEKGFTYNPTTGALYGEFNGQDVEVRIQTHMGKVWRLVISFYETPDLSEAVDTYNELYWRYINNSKYKLDFGEEAFEQSLVEWFNYYETYDSYFSLADSDGSQIINCCIFYWDADEYNTTKDYYECVLYYQNFRNRQNGEDL